MQLLEQCPPDARIVVRLFRRGLKAQSLAELLCIDDPRQSRRKSAEIALSCRPRNHVSLLASLRRWCVILDL